MSAQFDLPITQGASFNQPYQLKDLAGVNVNTSTVDAGPHICEVKQDFVDRGGTLQTTFSATLNATGLLTITFTGAQTRLVKDATWRWQVKAVEGAVTWLAAQGQFTGMTFEVAD